MLLCKLLIFIADDVDVTIHSHCIWVLLLIVDFVEFRLALILSSHIVAPLMAAPIS